MPPGCREFVFLDHPHFPVAVLRVLAEERRKRTARLIPALDLRTLPNPAAAPEDAEIVFVVLVPHQLLIEITEALERFTRPTAEIHAVHRTLMIGSVAARATNGERRLKGRSDGSRYISCAFSHPRTADVIRTRFFESLDAPADVIRRIFCVGIH